MDNQFRSILEEVTPGETVHRDVKWIMARWLKRLLKTIALSRHGGLMRVLVLLVVIPALTISFGEAMKQRIGPQSSGAGAERITFNLYPISRR
jgi:hypothetical protein